jgi:hypothetical protein
MWDNKRGGMNNIKVRLDRALADDRMLEPFADSRVTHIRTTESDHCVILIRLSRSGSLKGIGKDRSLRYENMWQRHKDYEERVTTAWTLGCNNLEDVHSSLGVLQISLKSWDKNKFGLVRKELFRLHRRLDEIR